jgi:hypothetical protein
LQAIGARDVERLLLALCLLGGIAMFESPVTLNPEKLQEIERNKQAA